MSRVGRALAAAPAPAPLALPAGVPKAKAKAKGKAKAVAVPRRGRLDLNEDVDAARLVARDAKKALRQRR